MCLTKAMPTELSPGDENLAMTSTLPKVMTSGGLAGVQVGVRVKLLTSGAQELLLSIPQVTATQIRWNPSSGLKELKFQQAA
jgi:hypothetical protein